MKCLRKHSPSLTIIEEQLCWMEIALLESVTEEKTSTAFDITWFSRYPLPSKITCEKWNEFLQGMYELFLSYVYTKEDLIRSTIRNPQSNGIIECLHLTIWEMLRIEPETPFLEETWVQDINTILQSCCWAVRTMVSPVTVFSPVYITFGREMYFPVFVK